MATDLSVVMQLQLWICTDDKAKNNTYSDVKYAYPLLKCNWVFHAYKLSYAQQWEFMLWSSEDGGNRFLWNVGDYLQKYSQKTTTQTQSEKHTQNQMFEYHKHTCTGNKIMQMAWICCFILTHWLSLWFSQPTECDVLHLQYNFMNRKVSERKI